jgi:hypothetical protein
MTNIFLKKRLLLLKSLDQRGRSEGRVDVSLDKKNVQELKEIIAKHGWPSGALVGLRAEEGAWLIVQHADFDLRFQRKCLQLMVKHIDPESSNYKLIAYLTDRVLVNQGKKQLFGTQFFEKNGSLIPRPIQQIRELAKRRQTYKLESFEKYRKRMNRLKR